MDGRTKKLEKLKNAVIVVLFLTTILLLNLTWRSEGSGSFRLPNVLDLISPDVWVPDAEEFMVPERSIYGFGDGTFSVSSWKAYAWSSKAPRPFAYTSRMLLMPPVEGTFTR